MFVLNMVKYEIDFNTIYSLDIWTPVADFN